MRSVFKVIRSFTQRHIGSKALAIWLLRSKLPAEWGRLTDLQLDREACTLTIFLEKNGAPSSIAIQDYRLQTESGETRLLWKNINASGEAAAFMKNVRRKGFIVIPDVYVALIEKLAKKKNLMTTAQ
ncbi:MAG: hypothetical protein RPT11_05445 [Bermanella sp.]